MGLCQSGTSWYPVITDSSYKVVVLVISTIYYVTHHYTNTTQNTPHKMTQTPHKTSPGKGLQFLIALFLVPNVIADVIHRVAMMVKTKLIWLAMQKLSINMAASMLWHMPQNAC